MHEIISAVSPLLSLASVVIAIGVGYGTIKARRDAPDRAWRDDLALWRARVEEKLDNDYHQLHRHERELLNSTEFQRVTLRSLKGILLHMVNGNHTDDIHKISQEIDNFLIER